MNRLEQTRSHWFRGVAVVRYEICAGDIGRSRRLGGDIRYHFGGDLSGQWQPVSSSETYEKQGATEMEITRAEVGQIVDAVESLGWVKNAKKLMGKCHDA